MFLERNVPSAEEGKPGGSGGDKKSRILSALLQDECKYLKDLGLGSLLSTEQRLTRHSELKSDEPNGDAGPRPRKRNRRTMPVQTKVPENGVEERSKSPSSTEVPKEQRRVSLPAGNAAVTVDENKNVATVAKKRKLDEAVVIEEPKPPNGVVKPPEKRVVREKESKVNGVSIFH